MRPRPRRARVSRRKPQAWATSDRSGFIGNQKNLKWQQEYAGFDLVNLGFLVYPDEYDEPNRQLGAQTLSADPPSVKNARVENYAIDEQPVSVRYTIDGRIRIANYTTPYAILRIVNVKGYPPA